MGIAKGIRVMSIFALILQLLGCSIFAGKSASTVTAWEHGWKTPQVTATRYENKQMGYNISFKFPRNPNDCDRAEISDFLEAHGGVVFQSGGYAGAETFVRFKGVDDRAGADHKLQALLPGLEQLMEDISAGKKIPPIVNPDAKQWPDTDPPDKTNPYWEFNNNLNVNGTPYKTVEVAPNHWQWVVNEQAVKEMAAHENHRAELARALVTRVLTEKEMLEVGQFGSSLLIRNNTPYYATEVEAKFQSMLLIQQTLRAEQPKP